MTARFMVGVLAVTLLGLAGCSAKEGQRLVEYERGGKSVQEKKAAADGRYTLHVPDRPGVTYQVAKGERVGFRKGSAGYVEAYAGDNPSVDIERDAARGAYWQFDEKIGR